MQQERLKREWDRKRDPNDANSIIEPHKQQATNNNTQIERSIEEEADVPAYDASLNVTLSPSEPASPPSVSLKVLEPNDSCWVLPSSEPRSSMSAVLSALGVLETISSLRGEVGCSRDFFLSLR